MGNHDDVTATENVLELSLARGCEKHRFRANGNEQKRPGDIEKANCAKQGLECKKPFLQVEKRALPKEGVEPSPCCQDGILNPARLPVPPLRLFGHIIADPKNFVNQKFHLVISQF